MKKIVFKSGKELEIDGISQSGNSLNISVLSKDVASIIETFSNPDNTAVMRYYVGIDLMCGYAGFKKIARLEYTPNIVSSIDYTQEDETTESRLSGKGRQIIEELPSESSNPRFP